jgi:VCBS repeat-containing protein
VLGSGSIHVDAGTLLDLNATVAATQKIVFDGAGSSEVELDASTFGGQIQGMAATDQIDLRTIGYGLNTTGTYVGDASGGVLTITDGTNSISMTLVGDYRHAAFAGASDGHGGTLVTLNADDDKPIFASAETTQTGAVTEFSGTTGSSASNPLPALTGSIHFTDIDLVDRPTATMTQSVTWTDHAADLSGSLSQPQIDALEQALLLQQSGNTNNGAIGWAYTIADDALDFLGDGQTATVTSTITLADHEGKADIATVTVTVTGANDKPLIDAIAVTPLFEQTDIDPLTTKIGVTFIDADLTDTGHTAAITAVTKDGVTTGLALTDAQLMALVTPEKVVKASGSSSGSVNLDFSAASTAFDYLAKDEVVTLTYSVAIDDQHGGVTPKTFVVDITGTNDAPVATAGAALTTITEDDTANAGQPVSSFATGITDVDNGAVQGIAITGFTSANGHWEFSTDHAASWSGFAVSYDTTSALLLASNDLVRFVPDGNNGGTDTLAYVAWDQTVGIHGTTADASAAGGSTAFSVVSDTVSLSVTDVNDAPILAAGTDLATIT